MGGDGLDDLRTPPRLGCTSNWESGCLPCFFCGAFFGNCSWAISSRITTPVENQTCRGSKFVRSVVNMGVAWVWRLLIHGSDPGSGPENSII